MSTARLQARITKRPRDTEMDTDSSDKVSTPNKRARKDDTIAIASAPAKLMTDASSRSKQPTSVFSPIEARPTSRPKLNLKTKEEKAVKCELLFGRLKSKGTVKAAVKESLTYLPTLTK